MLTGILLKAIDLGAEWVLWVLVALSMVNIAIVTDRFMYYRKRKVDGAALTDSLSQFLSAGDLPHAKEIVADKDSLECQVIHAGLMAYSRGPHAAGEAMQSAKSRYKGLVDSNLAILGTIGSNAPFVGLLGTVLGIIQAAKSMGKDAGDQAKAMHAIFEALVATAVGLCVAIPAIIFFNIFQRKVKGIISQVDSLTHLVLMYCEVQFRAAQKPSSSQPAAPRQAAAPQQAAARSSN
jgi:biopolymer transport protein ExbB/TolQ